MMWTVTPLLVLQHQHALCGRCQVQCKQTKAVLGRVFAVAIMQNLCVERAVGLNIIWPQDANLATQMEVMSTVQANGALHARLHQCMVENLTRRKQKSSCTLLNFYSCQCLWPTLIMKCIISTVGHN